MDKKSSHKAVILCVDDEKGILETLERQIHRHLGKDFDLELAESGEEGLEILHELNGDGREMAVIISDQIMPGMKGDEFLIAAQGFLPETLKILLTGQASLEAVRNAINGARLYRYVAKPWEPEDLMLTLEEAARSFLQRAKLIEYNQHNRLLKTLNQASQEISREMNPQNLVEKVIKNSIQNTGAEKVIVLMEERGRPMIKGIFSANEDEHLRLQNELKSKADELAKDTNNLIVQLQLSQKDLNHQMVIPLQYGEIQIGYLFLENNASKSAFNTNQQEIMSMLASQAAISLENARLYGKLHEAHQDITDSIHYARRIQSSLLPDQNILEKNFPGSFIIYKPKDIVSGDFYWFTEHNDFFYAAAVDCTGHGVPGAFMSILGSSQLTQIVQQSNLVQTGKILTQLHKNITVALVQNDTTGKVYDGMDLSLCKIDKATKTFQFSGANRSLLHYSNNQFTEYPPDKMPIGHASLLNNQERIFATHTIPYQTGDLIYIFSDGVTDQFGGEFGKKLTKRKFIELLGTYQPSPLSEQKEKLTNFIQNYMKGFTQMDDMLVICIGL